MAVNEAEHTTGIVQMVWQGERHEVGVTVGRWCCPTHTGSVVSCLEGHEVFVCILPLWMQCGFCGIVLKHLAQSHSVSLRDSHFSLWTFNSSRRAATSAAFFSTSSWSLSNYKSWSNWPPPIITFPARTTSLYLAPPYYAPIVERVALPALVLCVLCE